jgi:hypothetical protein
MHGHALKFRVVFPPVKGAANGAFCAFLAELFQLPKRSVVIQAGHGARRKRVLLKGLSAIQVRELFGKGLKVVAMVSILTLIACAGPKPILYPNAHLQAVGQDAAKEDIAECRQMAESAGAKPGEGKTGQVAGSTVVGAGMGAAGGAVGGAVIGAAGRGSAIGAASGATVGLLRGLFRRPHPGQAYVNFVNRCLKERGYEPVGWE